MGTKRKYKSTRTFDDTNPKGGKREIVKLEQFVEMFQLPKNNKYVHLRLVGPVVAMATHWIDIKTKEGKKVTLPKACSRYSPTEDNFDTTKDCLYCDQLTEYPARQRYMVNAILREVQEDQPSRFQKKYSKSEKASGFKDSTDSKAWTPIRVLSLPAGVAKKLKGLAQLNRHKVNGKTKAMPISDDEYGMDIMLKYDPDAQPAQAYDIQKGDASPLTDEEIDFLHWDIEGAIEKVSDNMEEDVKTQKVELKQLMKSLIQKDKNAKSAKYEDSDEPKKKKGKSKKEESSEESSEGSEESSELEMSDEPKKKAKSSKSSKSSKSKSKKEESSEESSEGSDESSELEMSEESSEESKPAKKSKSKSKSKSKKEESSEESEESSEESSEGSEESSELELSEEESSEESSEESEAPKKKRSSKKRK